MSASRVLLLEIESGCECNDLQGVIDLATGTGITNQRENQYSPSLSNKKATSVRDELVSRSFFNKLTY